ncbi:phage tail sheath protein [Helicobacter cynogastricus]|uniref:phage tail protein n=1 Tax=Helicobacter cynogastricus TaxID=329937 RepID=UPI001F333DF7|nr:phage tail protein [Helicobacter cynogastricus]
MAQSKYGINIEFKNLAPAPVKIGNSKPIAIIGDDTKIEGIHVANNLESALKLVEDGSIKETLKDFEATGIESQFVLSAFHKDTDEAANKQAVLDGVNALKKVEQEHQIKPKFFLAPGYDSPGLGEAMKIVAEQFRGIYALGLEGKNEAEVNREIEIMSTHRAILTFQRVRRLDGEQRPLSAFLIALYAKVMGEGEFGFAKSYSNRTIDGVIGIVDTIEYVLGQDCEADRLRDKGVSVCFVDSGIRAWGRNTRDKDLGIESLHTIVIFDTIIESILLAQKRVIDLQLNDALKEVTDSLDAFYRRLVANNVVVGYNISLPADLNTNDTIMEGVLYVRQEVQEMPLVSRIVNKIYRVSSYGTELIKTITGGASNE